MEGTYWFRRLVKECRKISPHIKFRRAKYGFYRIYWKEAYIHECMKDLPLKGFDIEELDLRMVQDRRYREEYEDQDEVVMKVKNYREGFWDALDRILTRVWLLKHDVEFNSVSRRTYSNMVVK